MILIFKSDKKKSGEGITSHIKGGNIKKKTPRNQNDARRLTDYLSAEMNLLFNQMRN